MPAKDSVDNFVVRPLTSENHPLAWSAQRAELHPRRRDPVREPRDVLFQYVAHGYTSVGSYDRMREFVVPSTYEGPNHRRHRHVNVGLRITRTSEGAELGTNAGFHA